MKFLFQCKNNIFRVSTANQCNISQQKKRNFASLSGHVMFYLWYLNTNEIPKPLFITVMFFAIRGAVHYLTIATLIFSHTTGSHAKPTMLKIIIMFLRDSLPGTIFHECLCNEIVDVKKMKNKIM